MKEIKSIEIHSSDYFPFEYYEYPEGFDTSKDFLLILNYSKKEKKTLPLRRNQFMKLKKCKECLDMHEIFEQEICFPRCISSPLEVYHFLNILHTAIRNYK